MRIKLSLTFNITRDHDQPQTEPEPNGLPFIDETGGRIERASQYDYEPEPVRLGFQPKEET